MSTVRHGSDEDIRLLLSQGAKIIPESLISACSRGDTVAFKAFLDFGWDINSVEGGQPALRLITKHEHVVRWFFNHGADPNVRGKNGFSVLATATTATATNNNSISDLELLIAHGAQLNPNALYSAMSPRSPVDIKIMKLLVERGNDVNAAGCIIRYHFASPLHWAATRGNREKFTILLDAGADKTIKQYGKTPADIAKERGNMEIFDLLAT